MKVIVNDKGDVKDVSAISGHPSLVRPATEAVSKWKFKPYLLEGKPVEVESQVTINFSLGGGGR